MAQQCVPPWKAAVLVFVVLAAADVPGIVVPAAASAGDRLPEFQRCVSACETGADGRGGCAGVLARQAAAERLLGWTCGDECRYACMHAVTAARVREEEAAADARLFGREPQPRPVLQFYGKWPFVRFLGMQEPASVLFSVLNGLAHYTGYRRLGRLAARARATGGGGGWPTVWWYRANAVVAMNAWVWSVVFHSRDVWWTERMDYFSAIASILVNLHVAVVRLTTASGDDDGNNERASRGKKTDGGGRGSAGENEDAGDNEDTSSGDAPPAGNTRARVRTASLTALGLFYLWHIGYLSLRQPFDYAYNMAAGVGAGVVSYVLWLWWCVRVRRGDGERRRRHPRTDGLLARSRSPSTSSSSSGLRWRRRHAWKMALTVFLIMTAMTLELLDFAPLYGVLDAHALWHLATWPILHVLYSFFHDDAAFDQARRDFGRQRRRS
ncbi:hypothetical protein HK405_004614 [Cladochytrium tenue]|nr:hypothetical protein HK405_004614 [Cladochytrium tenue]